MRTNGSDINDLEGLLQPQQAEEISVASTSQGGRITRGKDVSFSYTDLLSRKSREEQVRENNREVEPIQLEKEVIFSLIRCTKSKFTLTWRGHKIMGKGSYFGPWKRVTGFANEVAHRLLARFPREDFLDALDIVDPRQWRAAHDPNFYSSIFLCEFIC